MTRHMSRRAFLLNSIATGGMLALPRYSFASDGTDLTGGVDLAREFVMAEPPSVPGTRDAVNVWIEEENGAFGMRLGVEALAEEWDRQLVWLDIAFADGRVLSLRDQSGKPHSVFDSQGRPAIRGSGPGRFQCVDPFHQWNADFKGKAEETTQKDLMAKSNLDELPTVDVEFHIEMNMAVPPLVSGSLLFNKEAMKGDQGEFISPRYEQLFKALGSIRIGKNGYDFKGRGLRIRRQGVRKFEGFWGHCWQSALFPDGRAFGYNSFPPRNDGKPSFNEGYIFDGSGSLIPARAIQIPWITHLKPSGDNVSFVLETVDGRRVSIEGEVFASTRERYSEQLPDDFPIVVQGHAHYRWGGEETVGMVERSSLPSVFTDL